MKTAERLEARRLRREDGRSIKEIAALVGVSTASVSVWVRDIELSRAQLQALAERNPALHGQRNGSRVRAERAREDRSRAQAEGRRAARRGEPLHASGCMLFWAEGSRKRNVVHLANSDPALLAHFARFIRRYFDPPVDRMHLWCNIFADHADRQRQIEDFWLGVAGLPRSCLNRTTVNRYSAASQRKRTNRLPYGTARLSVTSTWIVQHLYGAIQEYGGFDRPEWLDLAA